MLFVLSDDDDDDARRGEGTSPTPSMSDTTEPPSQVVAPADKTSRWTQADDLVLVDGLTQQKTIGQNHDSIWTPEAWAVVAEMLKGSELVSGGAQKTLQQCKARWQRVSLAID